MIEEPTNAGRMGRKNGAANWSAGISGSAVLCVEAVAAIAADGGVISATKIAEAIGVDRRAAINCMAHLRGKGIVSSVFRRNGGYKLAVDPEAITALDVIRVVDANKPGSIFDDDVAPGFAKLLRKQLGCMPIKRIARESKSL